MSSSEPTADSTAHATGDADWLAVRYVLGELSAGDAADFDTRLADDQSVRDALLRATQLVEAVAAVSRQSVATVSRRRTKRLWRIAAGRTVAGLVATAALVVATVVAFRSIPDDAEPPLVTADVDPARLVMLWTASADSLNGNAGSDLAEDLSAGDPQSALLPPDWLLAAVEYEAMPASGIGPAGDLDADMIERN